PFFATCVLSLLFPLLGLTMLGVSASFQDADIGGLALAESLADQAVGLFQHLGFVGALQPLAEQLVDILGEVIGLCLRRVRCWPACLGGHVAAWRRCRSWCGLGVLHSAVV